MLCYVMLCHVVLFFAISESPGVPGSPGGPGGPSSRTP